MRTKYKGGLAINRQKVQTIARLQAMASTVVERRNLAERLGQSYGGDRDIYQVCGYPKSIDYDQYKGRFRRQDMAKRVVTAYPDATWRGQPEIFENEDPEKTTFEKAVDKVYKEARLWHYFSRVDKLAGIGRYAVLFLGLDDANNKTPNLEVKNAKRLMYVSPFSQKNAEISKYVTDHSDERFGKPLEYKLTITGDTGDTEAHTGKTLISSTGTGGGTLNVHWSRVIHVADGLLESDVFGTPRLEAVYNRLQDLELILAGGAEMFWRGGYPGYNFKADPDVDLSQDNDELEDEIDAYIHGLNRYLKLRGISVEELTGTVEDPTPIIDKEVDFISAATGIPQRILTGSERGELASTTDQENWESRVDERRRDWAEPNMVRETTDRLIEIGVLPPPGNEEEGYQVAWPPIGMLSEKDKAEITLNLSKALAEYVKNPGTEQVIPVMAFLTELMGFTEEQAESWEEQVLGELEEERKEAEEAAKAQAKLDKKTKPLELGEGEEEDE